MPPVNHCTNCTLEPKSGTMFEIQLVLGNHEFNKMHVRSTNRCQELSLHDVTRVV